jgi:phospholipase/carboxylesterase
VRYACFFISSLASIVSCENTSLPLVLVPAQGKAQLLFVLLHGEGAGPEQMHPLAQAIKNTFASAMLILPQVPHHDPQAHGHWVNQIRHWQAMYGLDGQQTALAGFSQAASLVLEACHARHDLAGRALLFSGTYRQLPASAPPFTLLHFFQGQNDGLVSTGHLKAVLQHLSGIEADATADIASGVGHELHPALIEQAMVRLKTCVPLRCWEEAMSELNNRPSGKPSPTPPSMH